MISTARSAAAILAQRIDEWLASVPRLSSATICLASIAAVLAMALHWWHPGFVIAGGDIPPVTDPWIAIQKSWLAWSNFNSYFGQVDGSFSFVPYLAIWSALVDVFGAGLGQVLMMFLLLSIGWIGVFLVCQRFNAGVTGSAIAAFAYTVNPYNQVLTGMNATQNSFAAMLPWVMLALVVAAGAVNRRPLNAWLLALLSGFGVAVLGITPQLLFELAVDYVLLVGLAATVSEDRPRFLSWALKCALGMSAAALWWLVPDALSFLGAQIVHATTPGGNSYIYARSSLLNNLRFLYQWPWAFDYYYPFAASYDGDPLTYASGFALVATAAVGLVRLRGTKLQLCRIAVGIALVMMFITKGLHGPFAFLNYAFFHLPLAFLYQEPGGASIVAELVLCITASLVLGEAMTASKSHLQRAVLIFCSLITIALSGEAMITGAIFHEADVKLPSMYVKVPKYWTDLATAINTDRRPGGVLITPPDFGTYQVGYSFGYYGTDTLATFMLRRPVMYLGNNGGYISHTSSGQILQRIDDLLSMRSPLSMSLLRQLGIRYVVFRDDVRTPYNVWLTARDLENLFHRSAVHFGPLSLIDLGTPDPKIEATQAWSAAHFDTWDAGEILELHAIEENIPRIPETQVSGAISPIPSLVESNGSADPPTGRTINMAIAEGGRPQRLVAFNHGDGAIAALDGKRREHVVISFNGVAERKTTAYGGLALAGLANFTHPLLGSSPESIRNAASIFFSFHVDNPGIRVVSATVAIVVPPAAQPFSYALDLGGRRYTANSDKANSAHLVSFRDVIVPPGESEANLSGAASMAAVLGRGVSHAVQHPMALPFTVRFSSVRSHAEVPVTIGDTSESLTSPSGIWNASPLASIPIYMSGESDPELTLTAGAAPLGVFGVLAFRFSGITYGCRVQMDWATALSLKHAAAGCLRDNGVQVTLTQLQSAMFTTVDIYADSDVGQQTMLAGLAATGRYNVTSRTPTTPLFEVSSPTAIADAPILEQAVSHGSWQGVLTTTTDAMTHVKMRDGDVVELHANSKVLTGQIIRLTPSDLTLQLAPKDDVIVPLSAVRQLKMLQRLTRLTVRWRAEMPLTATGIVTQLAGCVPDTGSASASVLTGHRLINVRYRLWDNGGGLQLGFGRWPNKLGDAALHDVTLTCSALVPSSGFATATARVDAESSPSSEIGLAVSGHRSLMRGGIGSVVQRDIRKNRHTYVVNMGRPPSSASVVAFGTGPLPRRLAAGQPYEFLGPTHLALMALSKPMMIVLNQSFSPSWIAVDFNRGVHILDHAQADGWRNAWLAPSGGRVLLLNAYEAFEVFGAFLTIGIILSGVLWAVSQNMRNRS